MLQGEAHIPDQVPSQEEHPDRLEAVLHVIYLVFNEGYSALSGQSLSRADLSGEAIRLGRLLLELLPETEVIGLLSMMLIQGSTRDARTSVDGDLILLEDQDRSLWSWELISEGIALIERALLTRQLGPYTIQAAIASVHARARHAAETEWGRIVVWYDFLLRAGRSPIANMPGFI